MNEIALITPVYNPTVKQLNNLAKTYTSLKDVISCFYLAVNAKSKNIELLKEKLKDFNCIIKVADDNGPDDALRNIAKDIREEFTWMVTCGELIEIKDNDFLKKVDKNCIVFGNTTFINQNGKNSSMNPKKFDRFYKYKIPILNLSSCIMSKDNFFKSTPIKKFKVATDYEQILRLYNLNLNLCFTDSYKLTFFNDGNSVQNKVRGIAEMYCISKIFYPKNNLSRILFYIVFLMKNRINPFKFVNELTKIDEYIN